MSIRTEDGSENPLAEVVEDFSNIWQRADFTLYPTDKKYRVVFSAQYENTEVSDGDIAMSFLINTVCIKTVPTPHLKPLNHPVLVEPKPVNQPALVAPKVLPAPPLHPVHLPDQIHLPLNLVHLLQLNKPMIQMTLQT